MPLLEMEEVNVHFGEGADAVEAVAGVSLALERGQILGLVGETGAGKSLTARAAVRCVAPGRLRARAITFDGIDILRAPEQRLREVRGARVGFVVQDARSALNPYLPIERSLGHVLLAHGLARRRHDAARLLADRFRSVGLPSPDRIGQRFPHELSGGMAQRALIAIALATDPDLLVADEATTGLDLTIQAQILDLLRREVLAREAAALVVTHDLGVVAQYCTHVAVMHAGRLREFGTTSDVLRAPAHEHTRQLLASLPQAPAPEPSAPSAQPAAAAPADSVLAVASLRKHFAGRGGELVFAVNSVDISLRSGSTLAIVGESGAGKSTLGRCILRLLEPSSGRIVLLGRDVTRMPLRRFRRLRDTVQAVFQDPFSSLDPRMSALEIVEEPLRIFRQNLSRSERRSEALALTKAVGLDETLAKRRPGELSGGQQQRLAIARAIATRPRLLVLDEPTASLDMAVRKQVIELLRALQHDFGLSYLLISHDLGTVAEIADEVVVMYLGEIVERGPTREVLARPAHPYTRALLSATLSADPDQRPEITRLRGEVQSANQLPHGCYLAARCPIAIDRCSQVHPELIAVAEAHEARCILLPQGPRSGAQQRDEAEGEALR